MEQLLSVVVSELMSRALSMVIHRYRQSTGEEGKLKRLQRLLLRIHTIVEEAEGQHITNQAMLQQLQMLREGLYRGNYMLDSFRYRGHEDNTDENEVSDRSFALPGFNSSRRPFPLVCSTRDMGMADDVPCTKKLDNMLDSLDKMIGGMEEFVIFLHSYPCISRQPYSTYLVLDRIMFGRQMEKETIVSFFLQREAMGDGNLGVLPIIGAARIGKSTLVEHVCLDERVHSHFSSIVILSKHDLNGGTGVIKQQNLHPSSQGKSIVIIELTGDVEEESWRRLYSLGVNGMARGSKIIITSRSEKAAAFGTTRALKLEFLPEDAYWYFFKAITFGSTNPEDHPKLAAIGMEIAKLLKRSFMAANMLSSLLRANFSTQFWRMVLKRVREYTSKHLLLYGKHPVDLLMNGRPIHAWTLGKTNKVIMAYNIYHECSPENDVPRITTQDVVSGSVVPSLERIHAVAHRSRLPPCYTYLVSYTVLSKKRSRQERNH